MLPRETPKCTGRYKDLLSSNCTYCCLLLRQLRMIFIELLLKYKFVNFFMSVSCWTVSKALE